MTCACLLPRAGAAALWAERQFQRRGIANIYALDARLSGTARRDRLPDADYLDVGEGLVAAPLDRSGCRVASAK